MRKNLIHRMILFQLWLGLATFALSQQVSSSSKNLIYDNIIFCIAIHCLSQTENKHCPVQEKKKINQSYPDYRVNLPCTNAIILVQVDM